MQNFVGTNFGQYKIITPIGKGGMGVVYRARDTRLNRDVALKVLPPELAQDKEFVARFRREAETAASLDHPHIVAIYNIGEQDGVYYLAMRLLHGHPLNDVLRQRRALSLDRSTRIVEQLARALDYAHARGVIHRDIKPANIMLGDDGHVTLMDFGIAKAMMGSKITRTGTMIGTPEYMAPEQFTGESVDHRADVYALSIVLYELLTGQVPFKGDTPVAISHGHVYQQPAPLRQANPQISPAVEQVVLRGLAKRPEARYPGAGALAEALRAATRGDLAPASEPLPQPLKIVLPDGREYALTIGALRLGRSEESDVVLRDTQVSRQHAEIRSDAHSSALIDLSSANGTFINDRRLAPHRPQTLRPGMEIRLGAQMTLQVQAGLPLGKPTVMMEPRRASAHPPTGTTMRAGKSSSVSVLGCVLGAVGIGMLAVLLLGVMWLGGGQWPSVFPPAVNTESPSTVVVTATPDPDAEPRVTPVEIVVTVTPSPEAVVEVDVPTPSPSLTPHAVDVIFYACGSVGHSNICKADLEGNVSTIISSASDDSEPDWCPTTQRIAFQSRREGNYDIFISDAQGRNVQNLTRTRDRDERLPNWAPGGWGLVYEVGDGVNNSEIRVLNITEGHSYSIATGRAPVWSPDGNFIAYMQKQANGYWQLRVYNVQNDTTRALSHSGEHARFPAWSPDGVWLAYNTFIFASSPRGQTYDVWRARADGSGSPQRLTTSGDSGRPAWSPDGQRVIFNHQQYLYILNVNTRVSTRLNHTYQGWTPDWAW